LRAKAEGLAYPLTVYAEELSRSSSGGGSCSEADRLKLSCQDALSRKAGVKEFLSEMNDVERALLRQLADISPNNFGAMYCVDLLWKLVLIRFEILLNEQEEEIKGLKERLD
jgi:hypothetical protein